MTLAVLSGFVLALAAPWLHRLAKSAIGWIMALLPIGLLIYFLTYINPVAAGKAFNSSLPWAPRVDLSLSFYLDGLSLLMALLISGIGALVLIYAGGYLKEHPLLGRFMVFILIFMASMLGVVLAGNLLLLYVFWELTSLSSYFLIGFEHEKETARSAALQALLVTSGGGLALLAGLILLGQIGGSFELSLLLDRGELIRADPRSLPALLLILAGAFTKSAQVPFHFWLPSAMEAPTPVSAYLHSATMVKAGIYLMARLSPILGGTPSWFYIVTTIGAVTMITTGILAFYQSDLKKILAYSTTSVLGLLTMLLGLGTPAAAKAAVTYLLAHALYKGALFLVAGAVDHETGTREITRLGGLRGAMPITAAAAGLAALSMAGLPPFFGFIGKEILYEAAHEATPLLTLFSVAAGALFVAVAGMVGLIPFTGKEKETPPPPHEAPPSLWLGPIVLAGLGAFFGLFPNAVEKTPLSAAAAAILGDPVSLDLALWHGLTPILALSAATVLIGAGLYAARESLVRATEPLRLLRRWGPARGYEAALQGMNALARFQTGVLQNGRLRVYLMTVTLTPVGLIGYTLLRGEERFQSFHFSEVRFYEVAIAILMLSAAMTAARSPTRLAAVTALGVVGYGVALIYILYGAPDLAMTQFLIETFMVILLVLVFYHLPGFTLLSDWKARARDKVISIAVGALMTMLILLASQTQLQPPISTYFAEQSQPAAHGRNIVNVILVDFRALDTLGEITVLAVAAIGVYALLKLRLEGKK